MDVDATAFETGDVEAMSAAELWADAYQGEVLGEALFSELAGRQSDATRRHQLEVLTMLERCTKELAQPILAARDIASGDSAASAAAGRELGEGVADLPWDEFLRSFEPVTTQFLAKYRRLVVLATDDEERRVADAYVAHELALMAYVYRALGEETGDPLEPILALPHVARAADRVTR
jgi:hypothetical protein